MEFLGFGFSNGWSSEACLFPTLSGRTGRMCDVAILDGALAIISVFDGVGATKELLPLDLSVFEAVIDGVLGGLPLPLLLEDISTSPNV